MEAKDLLKLVTCVVILCNTGAIEVTSDMLADFEDYVLSVVKCRQVTGLSITMVNEGKVLYSRGFGYAHIEDNVMATNDTKFCIGSLTKAFTSTVLAKLLTENKRFTWDTPLHNILGSDFRLTDELRSENVNLRDLLAHKVGLPGYFNALLAGFPENVTREDFIGYLEYLPAYLPFRTKFVYSNFMYTLAGYVAEKLGGKSWEELVTEYLLRPLNMSTSGFVTYVPEFDSSFAFSYANRNGKPVRLEENLLRSVDPLGPAGSIYSTANDMAKWITFHLRAARNVYPTPLTFDKDVVDEMYASQMAMPFHDNDLFRPKYPIDDVSLSYDLGWVTSVYRGYKRVWHSGGIVGFSSLLWLFPDQDVGIFISVTGSRDNDNQLPVKAIMSHAADMLLGELPWLNQSTACSFPAPWSTVTTPVPVSENINLRTLWNISRPIENYAGIYGHPAFGNITVSIENSTELILYYGRFGRLVLTPSSDLSFSGRYLGPLWFVTQSDGPHQPLTIDFSLPVVGSASNLSYPVDNTFPITFSRDFKQSGRIQSPVPSPCTTSGNARVTTTWIVLLGSSFVLMTLQFFGRLLLS